MITDSLDSCKQYFSVNSLFERVFDFAMKNIETIECGRYEIDGDRAFAMVVDASLKDLSDAKLEAHNRYIDIQIPISKGESFGVKPRNETKNMIGKFDSDNDICFFDDSVSNIVKVEKGEFIIFMPSDAHAPLIGEGEIRKMVIKIEVK